MISTWSIACPMILVVDTSIFYHDLENVIDRIDVSLSPDDLDSANGNIGDGERYGLRASASIRLGMLNLPNVLASSRFTVQDSRVRDPILGTDRSMRFNNRGRIELGFRHDIPRWNMNYGLNWNNTFDGQRIFYDLEDIELNAGDPFVFGFVEYVTDNGLTFRLEGRDLTVNKFCRERQRFVGPISSGIIEEIEDFCSSSGRVFAIKINWTF
ncbi:MAG: TonB-dependent receptor [Gammaproteobacteria bacterium]|nr:TonB-dependent receptor [Gammaproteobacteria bacterium]